MFWDVAWAFSIFANHMVFICEMGSLPRSNPSLLLPQLAWMMPPFSLLFPGSYNSRCFLARVSPGNSNPHVISSQQQAGRAGCGGRVQSCRGVRGGRGLGFIVRRQLSGEVLICLNSQPSLCAAHLFFFFFLGS